MYADISVKTAYIRDCELKAHVQEERHIKIKAKRQDETNFTPIRHYQENMPPELTQKQEKKSNSQSLTADRNPQRKTTRNSLAELPILLQREIPMAWGTTTDILTP